MNPPYAHQYADPRYDTMGYCRPPPSNTMSYCPPPPPARAMPYTHQSQIPTHTETYHPSFRQTASTPYSENYPQQPPRSRQQSHQTNWSPAPIETQREQFDDIAYYSGDYGRNIRNSHDTNLRPRQDHQRHHKSPNESHAGNNYPETFIEPRIENLPASLFSGFKLPSRYNRAPPNPIWVRAQFKSPPKDNGSIVSNLQTVFDQPIGRAYYGHHRGYDRY